MNNQYQSTPEPSNKDVWYSSYLSNVEGHHSKNTLNRYKNKITLTSYTGIKCLEFIKKSQIYIPESPQDRYYFVDASKRFRPDLISQEVYGTPVLYWVILSCNNLYTPLDVKINLTLRIPPLSSIMQNEQVM